MLRRAVCLLLACQLLLVQGLLCRSCPASAGQQAHAADRPHIHVRAATPVPAPAEPGPRGCPCCKHRAGGAEASRPAGPGCSAEDGAPRSDDLDGAVYLPASLVAAEAHRHVTRATDLLGVSSLPPATLSPSPAQVGGLALRAPTAQGPSAFPLSLRHFSLLI